MLTPEMAKAHALFQNQGIWLRCRWLYSSYNQVPLVPASLLVPEIFLAIAYYLDTYRRQ